MDRDDVTGLEPAVLRPAVGAFLGLEVGGRDRRSADLELAHRLAVPGHEPVLAARTDLDERDRNALLGTAGVCVLRREARLLAGRARDRSDRAHLGHAPPVDDVEAVALRERLDHRAWGRRASHGHEPDRGEIPRVRSGVERLQDPHPDRRDARGDRHFLLRESVEEARRIHVRPWEDLLDAGHRAREREAPRVRVEHRHDREAHVVRVHPEAADHRERVDRDRAMRVENALRPAGRTARVTHRCGRVLGEVAIRERGLVRIREQLLVVDRAVRSRSVTDRDDVLEVAARDELLGERPQRLVHEDDAVAAVRGDVRVVVGVEAEIERVRDEPADRSTHVGLEVLRVVPHERPDAVAVLETELAQRDDELLRARDEVGVCVACASSCRAGGSRSRCRRRARRRGAGSRAR